MRSVSSALAKIRSTAERHAGWVVLLWLAAAVALITVAPPLSEVGSQDTADFLPHDAPSQQADRVIADLFPDDPSRDAAIVVLERDRGLTTDDQSYIARLVTTLQSDEWDNTVRRVQSAATEPDLAPILRSQDGEAELLVVSLAYAPFSTSANHAIDELRAMLDDTAPEGLSVRVTGIAGLAADQADALVESFDRTALVTIALVLVILVLVYRSVVAPFLALTTIGVAFLVAQGVIGYLAEAGFKVSTMVGTFMIVMAFGAGTDYCLFIISRYREELAAGDPVPTTVRRTMGVMTAVITASAATVVVGFMSMLTAQFGIYRTMGPAIGIAVFVTLLASLTLTPALLRLAGRRAFWPQRLDAIRDHSTTSRRWERMAHTIRRRPAVILALGVVVLALPTIALTRYHDSFDLINDLPADADAREGFDLLGEHYPGGTVSPVYVIVRADDPILDGDRLDAIDALTERLRDQPGIAEVRSVTQPAAAPLTTENIGGFIGSVDRIDDLGLDLEGPAMAELMTALESDDGLRLDGELLRSTPGLRDRLGPLLGEDGNSTRLIVALDGNPYENDALDAYEQIDDTARAALDGTELDTSRVSVGGPTAFYADMRSIGARDFRVLFVVLLAAIFVVLALLLRSLVAPLYLLATVVLSYAATMGITVIVFQEIGGDPGITFWLAPFLFVVLVALGADYNIFIMSRIREEADAGHEIREATTRGLVLTGRIITSAGLILAGTFAALMLAPLPNLRQIGFGVTVGILIDTFVVRSLLVPSATLLLGRWAFWPSTPKQAGQGEAPPSEDGPPDRRHEDRACGDHSSRPGERAPAIREPVH